VVVVNNVPPSRLPTLEGLSYSFGRHPNRGWQTSRGPLLDAGAYVVGLKCAVLADLGAEPAETVMVGDDVESDIDGAKAALEAAEVQPEVVVESIADVPVFLREAE
jgi:hypothetical protein